jgi:hypothetical protein
VRLASYNTGLQAPSSLVDSPGITHSIYPNFPHTGDCTIYLMCTDSNSILWMLGGRHFSTPIKIYRASWEVEGILNHHGSAYDERSRVPGKIGRIRANLGTCHGLVEKNKSI